MIVEVAVDGIDQIGNTFENTPANTFVGDLAEPALDKIQPRAGGGDEVQMEPRMPFEPGFDSRMLVGAVIVDDEMEIVTGRSIDINFIEEPDKFLMPVARHAIADHLAVEHAQGREQGGGAVTLIIVSHRSAAALLERQPRLRAVQRLDLAFLVDTKDERFIGWIQVKTDDISEFLHKVLVSTEFEGFDQMGLQVMLTPDSLNGHAAQALSFGHCAHTPVSGVRRSRMKGGFHHGTNLSGRDFRESARTRGIFLQASETESQKTLSPELNRWSRSSKALGNLLVQYPVGRHLDDFGPLYQTQGKTSSVGPSTQYFTFFGRQRNGLGHSHAGDHRTYFDISKEINGTLH